MIKPSVTKQQDAYASVHVDDAERPLLDAPRPDEAHGREPIFEGGAPKHDTTHPDAFFDPHQIDFNEPGEESFPRLADLLVYLRETYPDRLANGRHMGARVSLPATRIATYLKDRGYTMSSGSYSLLEQGKTLPGDPIAFFTLLCDCLAIKPTSKYRPLLLYQYLFDSAARSIGDAFAEQYVERGDRALQTLRAKKPSRPRSKPRAARRKAPQRVFA